MRSEHNNSEVVTVVAIFFVFPNVVAAHENLSKTQRGYYWCRFCFRQAQLQFQQQPQLEFCFIFKQGLRRTRKLRQYAN